MSATELDALTFFWAYRFFAVMCVFALVAAARLAFMRDSASDAITMQSFMVACWSTLAAFGLVFCIGTAPSKEAATDLWLPLGALTVVAYIFAAPLVVMMFRDFKRDVWGTA